MTPSRPPRPGPRRWRRHPLELLGIHQPPTADEIERRARQRLMNVQLRVWTPLRVLGFAMAGLAVLVAVVHWLAHIGWRPIPLSMGSQDLIVRYPSAALLAVAAAMIVGRKRLGA